MSLHAVVPPCCGFCGRALFIIKIYRDSFVSWYDSVKREISERVNRLSLSVCQCHGRLQCCLWWHCRLSFLRPYFAKNESFWGDLGGRPFCSPFRPPPPPTGYQAPRAFPRAHDTSFWSYYRELLIKCDFGPHFWKIITLYGPYIGII